MPPALATLSPYDVVKRNTGGQEQAANSPDLLLLSPGPLIGIILAARACFSFLFLPPPFPSFSSLPNLLLLTDMLVLVSSVLGLCLAARLGQWLAVQVRPRFPHRRRVATHLPVRYSVLQALHRTLPGFIASQLPDPAPPLRMGRVPPSAAPHHHPDYPARSIDTLPPYPGFVAPDSRSPSDSRRFLFLVPIMPILHAFAGRPSSPTLHPHGSATAVGSAATITVLPIELPPPDYDTLTPPDYNAHNERMPAAHSDTPTPATAQDR